MAGYVRKVESGARGYSKRIRAVQFEDLVGLKHPLAKTNGTGFCRGHTLRIPLSLRLENPMIKYVIFADTRYAFADLRVDICLSPRTLR